MGLTMVQRKAVLASQVAAWPKATKAEKSAILDHLVAVNGWHRDHARKMIRAGVAGHGTDRAVGQRRAGRAPVYTYDEAAVAALATCWAVLGGPTGKRLQPALAALVPALLAHGELPEDPAVIDAVLAMSAATIDRRLTGHRVGLVAAKGRSLTRPGSLLKSSIPVKTWHEWDDARPGFLEIDLVGHEGGDNNGDFHYTLDATDVATGWTEAISIASKGERTVSAALTRLQLRFPFAVLGIHSVVLGTPSHPTNRAATCGNDTPRRSLMFEVEQRIVRWYLHIAGDKKVCGERWRTSPGPDGPPDGRWCAA